MRTRITSTSTHCSVSRRMRSVRCLLGFFSQERRKTDTMPLLTREVEAMLQKAALHALLFGEGKEGGRKVGSIPEM